MKLLFVDCCISQRGAASRTLLLASAYSTAFLEKWPDAEIETVLPETLLALSRLFRVSVNTLLGSPRTLVCQSCGMPLSDDFLPQEPDGTLNEKYCKWCWADGQFVQNCTMEEMVEHCIPHMPLGQSDPEACRAYMRGLLPTLERWKTP